MNPKGGLIRIYSVTAGDRIKAFVRPETKLKQEETRSPQ